MTRKQKFIFCSNWSLIKRWVFTELFSFYFVISLSLVVVAAAGWRVALTLPGATWWRNYGNWSCLHRQATNYPCRLALLFSKGTFQFPLQTAIASTYVVNSLILTSSLSVRQTLLFVLVNFGIKHSQKSFRCTSGSNKKVSSNFSAASISICILNSNQNKLEWKNIIPCKLLQSQTCVT